MSLLQGGVGFWLVLGAGISCSHVDHVQLGRWQFQNGVQFGDKEEHLAGNDVDQQCQSEAQRVHSSIRHDKVGRQERQPHHGNGVDANRDELGLVEVGRKLARGQGVHCACYHQNEVNDEGGQEACFGDNAH